MGDGAATNADPNIARIVHAILDFVRPERVIWFGSRVRDTGTRYSDYDIALEGVEMDVRTERLLRERLDEVLGIFSVDLVCLEQVEPWFREIVERDGVVVYEQG